MAARKEPVPEKEPVLVDVVAMGKKGGKARAKSMTKKQRSEAARLAVQARWAKAKAAKPKKKPRKAA